MEKDETWKRQERVMKKPDDSKLEFGDGEVEKVVEMAENTEAETKEVNTTFITNMMPVVQEMMKRGKTIQFSKSPDSKEEFEDEEVAKLVEKAKEMEAKAKNGHIKEAKSMFAEIFEEMKAKRFSAIQTKLQCCDLYSKIVKLHNESCSFDEALVYTFKTLDYLNQYTATTKLQIEVCANAATAFLKKNEMGKAKVLIEKAVAMAEEDFGPKSSTYADALVAYSGYLDKTEQRQKSNEILQTALEIVERKEGKESVAYARILSRIAFNNYSLQRTSGSEDYSHKIAG